MAVAQQATLDTREGKRLPNGFGEQLTEWRTRAVGVPGRPRTRRLVNNLTGNPVRTLSTEQIDIDPLAAQVVDTLQGSRSTLTQ